VHTVHTIYSIHARSRHILTWFLSTSRSSCGSGSGLGPGLCPGPAVRRQARKPERSSSSSSSSSSSLSRQPVIASSGLVPPQRRACAFPISRFNLPRHARKSSAPVLVPATSQRSGLMSYLIRGHGRLTRSPFSGLPTYTPASPHSVMPCRRSGATRRLHTRAYRNTPVPQKSRAPCIPRPVYRTPTRSIGFAHMHNMHQAATAGSWLWLWFATYRSCPSLLPGYKQSAITYIATVAVVHYPSPVPRRPLGTLTHGTMVSNQSRTVCTWLLRRLDVPSGKACQEIYMPASKDVQKCFSRLIPSLSEWIALS